MSHPPATGRATADLVVVGLGPAGRALTHRASAHGLDVIAVDPNPDRRWTPTYSAWKDELPFWLPASVIGTSTDDPAVWTTRRQSIDRTYCVLDTLALQTALRVDNARLVTGTAQRITSSDVTLTDGTIVSGATVVDARGTIGMPRLAEQTAYGVIVPREVAEPLLESAGAWFMDWRHDNGTDPGAVPSFLYTVRSSEESILLEETCLVGRPALDIRVLRDRLHIRLRARGLVLSGSESVERVRFPVQPPPRKLGEDDVVRFGSRSPMMHPATGYSVAASLAAVDDLVDAVRRGRRVGSLQIWAVQRLRNLGLKTALALDPALVPQFFASFFDLPVALQASYLSGRSDAAGTVHAMIRMFPTLPTATRLAIARTVLNS
ncbi:lycopene cyclase family protein [Rhodococcus sp. G-MC3]|uniref:lycopene cyclase family protein n=1 Tax=Rhodococcus sp. G-MC3 TaxID=3046209 RepID=UPI0024BAF309|nr:lycopene cyclase family protein [Rhodococcus sp. G-MC3]MDJ0394920.1 lycopene cyclase family protein [Rhodococcus sp. G-MC3]